MSFRRNLLKARIAFLFENYENCFKNYENVKDEITNYIQDLKEQAEIFCEIAHSAYQSGQDRDAKTFYQKALERYQSDEKLNHAEIQKIKKKISLISLSLDEDEPDSSPPLHYPPTPLHDPPASNYDTPASNFDPPDFPSDRNENSPNISNSLRASDEPSSVHNSGIDDQF